MTAPKHPDKETVVPMIRRLYSARIAGWAALAFLLGAGAPNNWAGEAPTLRVAAVVTEYRHNSHADMILSRLLLTSTLDGKGDEFPLKLASLYTDQKPPNDISRLLAAALRFPIKASVADALTLETKTLAV